MGVPVVNHIIPYGSDVGDLSEGPCSGLTLVDIWGREFRETPIFEGIGPSGDVQSGLVVADAPKTVSVKFGGTEALRVDVISGIHLRVLTPVTPLDGLSVDNYGVGDVDVIVTNLDDNGDPIPGETVTVTDGFSYRKVKLDGANKSDLLRIVEALIKELKKQVISNVMITVHTEYDSSTGDGLNITDIAEIPAIVIAGPDLPENRFYSLNERPEQSDNSDVDIRRRPRTVDIIFDIIGISDSTEELLNLMHLVNEFVNRNIYLQMLRDPDNLSLGYVSYEFGMQEGGNFEVNSRLSTSNMRSFSGTVIIRGFDIEGFADFSYDAIYDRSVILEDDVDLEIEKNN
jgi:hypothetical protein